MGSLSSIPTSAYLNEVCPDCLAEPVQEEAPLCPRCGYQFPHVFVVPTDYPWDYSTQLLEKCHAHDGLRLLGRFTGRQPGTLATFTHLRYLYLSRYPEFRFGLLKEFGRLRFLELDDAAIERLDGLASLGALTCLQLTECRRLSDLSGLVEAQGLRHFRLALCNRVADLAPIGRIQALEALKIEARRVESVAFLRLLPGLRRLALAVPSLPADVGEAIAGLEALEWLGLRRRYATKALVATLRERRPGCHIEIW